MNNPGPSRDAPPFVFLDPAGKRWSRLRWLGAFFALFLFIALVCFVQALLVTPKLLLPPSVRQLKGQLRAAQEETESHPRPPNWEKYARQNQTAAEHQAKLQEKFQNQKDSFRAIRAGFYVDWDSNSFESLQQHWSYLTHLCPEWGSFADSEGNLTLNHNPKLQHFVESQGLVLMPILSNFAGRQWQPEAVESLANGPASRREHFIITLLRALEEAKAGGVVLDWEQIDPTYKENMTALISQMARALHAVNKQLWLMVPMGDGIKAFDLPQLAPSVDHFVAQLIDENSGGDTPGPIASQDWVEGWLQVVTAETKSAKWIAALGAYGYDWQNGRKKAEEISFRDAMSRASYAGVRKVRVSAPNYNPLFSYHEPDGEHTVCFLDAVTFLNHLRAAREAGVGGIAVQRLGLEDPHVWSVLAMRDIENPRPSTLERMANTASDSTVTNVGDGEMATVDDVHHDGHRSIELVKGEGGYFSATYDDFPTYPVVFHEGAADEHSVAITFDDGPDPTWTPKILDILKKRNVKATFFLVGSQAETYPGLVRRIVDEGHVIGNHSYTHSNFGEISEKQIQLELNATQRLLESITGRSTTLVRPPYNADARPTKLEELRPLKLVQDELGYLILLESIDPQDWARPGAEAILNRVKEQRNEGSIILLHDAGGNRSQTVEALPQILDYLEARGDTVVPLNDLLQIPRDELMPFVPQDQKLARLVSGVGFSLWRHLEEGLWAFMITATGLVVLRGLVIAWLAGRHHRKEEGKTPFHPPVSVLIAAYNEEKVIASTLRAVLLSDYPGELEIVVVDDGSSDATAAIVTSLARSEPRVRLFSQPNGGKSTALRKAVAMANHEFLVFLDADTVFERRTITELLQPLADEGVGAVSGHAKVGNQHTFITRCQALEYSCGFNLDRRAYALWNCITVAPGAISALRRSALEMAGGFSHDTLAEDTDLTLSLHKAGYRIAYAHDAVAWTEAPETMRALAKQRFRWAFGTLQCLWKHRDLVFNPGYKALGWFALPSVWFCQVLLVAITPIVDACLIFSLLSGNAVAMGVFFVTFLAMDIVLALVACALDEEPLWKAWRILPMRIIYRPLLSWVIWRSIMKAAKGAWVTWGKLERTANVKLEIPL